MALALGLGVAGSLPFFFLADVWAYALVGVAGLVVSWLVSDRLRGLTGLLLGIAIPFAVWGGVEVARKVESCRLVDCSGLSSPNLTIAIVIAFGLMGLTSGAAGYLVGRAMRAVARRLRAAP